MYSKVRCEVLWAKVDEGNRTILCVDGCMHRTQVFLSITGLNMLTVRCRALLYASTWSNLVASIGSLYSFPKKVWLFSIYGGSWLIPLLYRIVFNEACVKLPDIDTVMFCQFSLLAIRSRTVDNGLLPQPVCFFFTSASLLSAWQLYDGVRVEDRLNGGKRTSSLPAIMFLPLGETSKEEKTPACLL